jgi:hypothetical protein
MRVWAYQLKKDVKMTVVVKGQLVLQDPETEEQVTVEAKSFHFETVDSDERGMGAELTHEAEVEVEVGETTHTVVVRVWEYPEGVLNDTEVDTGDLVVIKGLSIDVIMDGPDNDDDDY